MDQQNSSSFILTASPFLDFVYKIDKVNGYLDKKKVLNILLYNYIYTLIYLNLI